MWDMMYRNERADNADKNDIENQMPMCATVSLCIMVLLMIAVVMSYATVGFQPPPPPSRYDAEMWWCSHCAPGSCGSLCWRH